MWRRSLGNPNLSLQFSGLFDISHDVRTFSSQREEGSVQLGQKLSRTNTVQYRFTFRKVNVLGTPADHAGADPAAFATGARRLSFQEALSRTGVTIPSIRITASTLRST